MIFVSAPNVIFVSAPNVEIDEWKCMREGSEIWFRPHSSHPYDIRAYTCYRVVNGEWVPVDSCIPEFRN